MTHAVGAQRQVAQSRQVWSSSPTLTYPSSPVGSRSRRRRGLPAANSARTQSPPPPAGLSLTSLSTPTLEPNRSYARKRVATDRHALQPREAHQVELATVFEAEGPRVAAADPQRPQRGQLAQLAALEGGEAAGTDIDALKSRTVGDAEAGAAAGVRVVEEAVWGDGEGEEMGEAAEREGVGETEALFSNGEGAQTDQEGEVECGKTGVVAAAVTDGEFFSVGGEEETERRGNE